jgi:hypothetical protein
MSPRTTLPREVRTIDDVLWTLVCGAFMLEFIVEFIVEFMGEAFRLFELMYDL